MAAPAIPTPSRRDRFAKFLKRVRRRAIEAVQLVAFAATFVLVGGVLGAVVGKPIVVLVAWVWRHTWPW